MTLSWFKRDPKVVEDDDKAEVAIPPMKWKSQTPEMDANIFSGLLFLWLQPLFTRASFLSKRGLALEANDLPPLPSIDLSKSVEAKFQSAYNSYQKKSKTKGTEASSTPTAQTTSTGTFADDHTNADAKAALEARLVHSLLATCKQRLITAGVIKFFNTALQFTFPVLLNQILIFFQQYQAGAIPADAPNAVKYRGYWLSCLLFFFIACKAITESAYFHKVNRCAWQVKTSVSISIYTKALRLATSEQQKTTLGEMVNLMQVDASKLEAFVPQIHVLWDGMFQIAGYMTILGFLLGWPCVIGLVLMCFAGPVMGIIMGKLFAINRSMVKFTDERVKVVNEALQGIRCVKMYTWEDSFRKVVAKSRDQELESLRRIAYLRGFSRAYMTALPTLAAVVTFIAFAYGTDRPITAATLFSALVAFDQLRFPLMFYPMALAQYAQAKVSLGRVAIFLGYMEVNLEGYHRDEKGQGEIVIENATVYWSDPNIPVSRAEIDDKSLDKSEHTKSDHSRVSEEDLVYPKPVVSDISLRIAPGELCAVVGRVGSGKSSLCASILNETVLAQGSSVKLTGKVAYVAQSAWILNTSVRDNILFGSPYDETRYQRVLEVCQLTHDLEMLDDGDMTEIGEKGINLSGGQKQRVSLARAAYSNADVLIFDDPLSALDPEVAIKVFEECIIGFLKGKTRLLVTNQLQCLPRCDCIVALGKGGHVIEQGTYEYLMTVEKGEVQRLLKDLEDSAKKSSEASDEALSKGGEGSKASVKPGVASPSPSKTEEAPSEQEGRDVKTLVTREEREVGAVKAEVYLKYMRAGGGFFRFSFVFLFFILSTAVNLVRDVWISLWTSDTSFVKHGKEFYLGGYAGFAILVGVFTFYRSYLLAFFGVRASKEMHQNVLSSIFRAPMSFFDTTPTGRILSRFSKDMFTIDQELVDVLDFVVFMALSVVVTIATIAFATPWFIVTLLPLGFVYFKILNYFRAVSRETKRLESLSRSPVYSHFSETLGGLSTIRAYGESNSFISDFETKLDVSTQASYCIKSETAGCPLASN
ncbi:hypothetical protein MHU86_17126 [Fragilaria crotonensis]|nr:hypothetical protein MHU86_17126 [Fragilaria crotonensis]